MALMKVLFVVLPLFASAGISPELQKCVQDKLADAKGKCQGDAGPTCKPECISAVSAALPTLDGSCCELATKIPKGVCKVMIAAAAAGVKSVVDKCPAEAADRELAGISPELQKCVKDKLEAPASKCVGDAGPKCKPECISAVSAAIPTLDGSCCELATKISKSDCKVMIKAASAGLESFAGKCQAQELFSLPWDLNTEENSGSTATSEIPSFLLTGTASIVVGAAAVSLVAVWLRRRSNLPAHQALHSDGGDHDLDALIVEPE